MKFSVLIPTRDRLQYLAEAVETVRRQDYPDWEIVISDNFSQDDIGGFVESLNEPRIRYFRTSEPVPVTDNWNNAIEKATGDYIIMLGDDDALLPGYFDAIRSAMDKFPEPDLLYTGAYLFSYPGAVPEHPDGYLTPYSYAVFFGARREPFLLSRAVARNCVSDAFNFRCTYGFNMQFFVFKRQFVESQRPRGPFFQSPFPDYYAANVSLWMARHIVVLPRPLVVIGITPKSYGSYHHRKKEREGIAFLHNEPRQEEIGKKLSDIILPGTNINTSWLLAMELIKDNFGSEIGLKVNYRRYRFLQILYTCRNIGGENRAADGDMSNFNLLLTPSERLCATGIRAALWLTEHMPRGMGGLFKRLLRRLNRQYVEYSQDKQSGKFENMLQVFESFSRPS